MSDFHSKYVVGETVLFKRDNAVWDVGVINKVDRHDENLPWRVDSEFGQYWCRDHEVKKAQYVIDEEPSLL